MTPRPRPVHEDAHARARSASAARSRTGRASTTRTRSPSTASPGHVHRAGRASAGRRPATCAGRAHQRLGARSTRRSSSPTTTSRSPTWPSPTPASASTTVQLRVTSPYATSGSGNELTGQVERQEQPDHALPAAVRRRLHRHQRRAQPVAHRRGRRHRHHQGGDGLRHQRDPRVADRVQHLQGLLARATAFATHVRDVQPLVGAERAVHRRARAGHQEEHLLPLVADALQLPRRRHPRPGLPVPDLGRGRARLQQRDRADPADAHRRPEVPAQPGLLVRAVAVGRAGRPRAAGSSTTRATRRTGRTATPSTSPRRPGAATRSTAASRPSPATWPSTPRATSRASWPSTTTTTTGSSSTTGAR